MYVHDVNEKYYNTVFCVFQEYFLTFLDDYFTLLLENLNGGNYE